MIKTASQRQGSKWVLGYAQKGFQKGKKALERE